MIFKIFVFMIWINLTVATVDSIIAVLRVCSYSPQDKQQFEDKEEEDKTLLFVKLPSIKSGQGKCYKIGCTQECEPNAKKACIYVEGGKTNCYWSCMTDDDCFIFLWDDLYKLHVGMSSGSQSTGMHVTFPGYIVFPNNINTEFNQTNCEFSANKKEEVNVTFSEAVVKDDDFQGKRPKKITPNLKICSYSVNDEPCYMVCEIENDDNNPKPTVFYFNKKYVGKCHDGNNCDSNESRYLLTRNSTGCYLYIQKLNRAQDEGSWYCKHNLKESRPAKLTVYTLPRTITLEKIPSEEETEFNLTTEGFCVYPRNVTAEPLVCPKELEDAFTYIPTVEYSQDNDGCEENEYTANIKIKVQVQNIVGKRSFKVNVTFPGIDISIISANDIDMTFSEKITPNIKICSYSVKNEPCHLVCEIENDDNNSSPIFFHFNKILVGWCDDCNNCTSEESRYKLTRNSTGCYLYIQKLNRTLDEGSWYCEHDRTDSRPAKLTVYTLPKIITLEKMPTEDEAEFYLTTKGFCVYPRNVTAELLVEPEESKDKVTIVSTVEDSQDHDGCEENEYKANIKIKVQVQTFVGEMIFKVNVTFHGINISIISTNASVMIFSGDDGDILRKEALALIVTVMICVVLYWMSNIKIFRRRNRFMEQQRGLYQQNLPREE